MTTPADTLAEAAARFVETLGPAAGDACFPFTAEHRTTWTYLPGERPGQPTVGLHRRAGRALHRLLAATVAPHVHAQVTAIMGLEDPLAELQGRDRHVGDYWVAVYGDPAGDRWAWRLGGHHVSVRATVVAGRVRVTPLFLGANPARIRHQTIVVSQPLAPEEELGFRLMASLDDRQHRTALLDADPPPDIVTGDAPLLADVPPAAGLRLGDLAGEAQRLAERLVGVYLGRLPEPLRHGYEREVLPHAWGDLRFGWAGATTPPAGARGPGHYYRLQGPRFLAELDNTQDGVNHVHTVWRDPDGDHGADL